MAGLTLAVRRVFNIQPSHLVGVVGCGVRVPIWSSQYPKLRPTLSVAVIWDRDPGNPRVHYRAVADLSRLGVEPA